MSRRPPFGNGNHLLCRTVIRNRMETASGCDGSSPRQKPRPKSFAADPIGLIRPSIPDFDPWYSRNASLISRYYTTFCRELGSNETFCECGDVGPIAFVV